MSCYALNPPLEATPSQNRTRRPTYPIPRPPDDERWNGAEACEDRYWPSFDLETADPTAVPASQSQPHRQHDQKCCLCGRPNRCHTGGDSRC